jgi:hypothetical protein
MVFSFGNTPAYADGENAWKILGKDVVLVRTDPVSGITTEMATNPFGVAQLGNMLYIIDNESRMIIRLGANELNGLAPGNHELELMPFDPNAGTSGAGLPANARGQAIIVLKDGSGTPLIFALYTVSDSANPPAYSNSILIRMGIDPNTGFPVYQTKLDTLAKNAQELSYIQNFDGSPALLIPCLGGPVVAGAANGENSKLDMVRPFTSPMTTRHLFKSVNNTPGSTVYWNNIKIVAAPPDAGPDDFIYIFTGSVNVLGGMNWVIYRTTINQLKNMNDVSLAAAGFSTPDSGYNFHGDNWDLYYEKGTGPNMAGDRLWFVQGSPIFVSKADYYYLLDRTFREGYAPNQIGAPETDSAVMVYEAVKQAAQGVSLKRGLHGILRIPRRKEGEEEK